MTFKYRITNPGTRRAILFWIAVFPTVSLLIAALEPLIGNWPLLARTFVLTVIMVPALQFIIMPKLMNRYSHWVQNGTN